MLRSWQPERGLSLLNFVSLVIERQTASILCSGRRSPWKEDPVLPEDLDRADREGGPEEIATSREQLKLLLRRLIARALRRRGCGGWCSCPLNRPARTPASIMDLLTLP